jgi:hypothetical protein
MNVLKSRMLTALSTLALAACSSPNAGPPAGPSESKGESALTTEGSSDLENAERGLDVGKVEPGSIAKLELLAKNGTGAERDDAAIALSRSYELEGKTEDAIRTLEDLIAVDREGRWDRQDDVENQLAKLITGKSAPVVPDSPESNSIAPFARVLMDSFHPNAKGAYDLDMILVGGNDMTSERLGTFNAGGAIRERLLEQCPLCDKRPDILTHRSRVGTWLAIPKYRETFATSLSVFYYDQVSNRIPARYEQYLPMTVKEIDEHLASGQGLVAAKAREAAPPVLLIAAPRMGQISDVEAALADMKELPGKPVSVKLTPNLRPNEIQAVVRTAKKDIKACYETLLRRDANAAGKVMLDFAIDTDGRMKSLVVKTDDESLDDATFLSCFEKATSALEFPSTGVVATVKYPFVLSR